jgi:hypothetical protein
VSPEESANNFPTRQPHWACSPMAFMCLAVWRSVEGAVARIGSAQCYALYQHNDSFSVFVSRKVWPGGIYAIWNGSEIVTLSG